MNKPSVLCHFHQLRQFVSHSSKRSSFFYCADNGTVYLALLNMVTLFPSPPKGSRGCLMSPPCLESQGCHLIPLYYLLSCSSAKSCYPFCLIVFCLLALSSKLFPENSSIFSVKRQAFLYDSCLAVGRRKLIGGMCSMLSYDIGICCYAFIYIYFFYCFCPFLFFFFLHFLKIWY